MNGDLASQLKKMIRAEVEDVVESKFVQLGLDGQSTLERLPRTVEHDIKPEKFAALLREFIRKSRDPDDDWVKLTVVGACRELGVSHNCFDQMARDYGFRRSDETLRPMLRRLAREWFPQWS